MIDALACGVPVIATEAGGVPEIIQNGVNGFLAPIKRPIKLAEQVNLILSNAEIKKQIIEKGKETARQFSKSKMAEKTYRVYEKLVK